MGDDNRPLRHWRPLHEIIPAVRANLAAAGRIAEPDVFACRECRDTGFRLDEHSTARRVVRCHCQPAGGAPHYLREARVDNFEVTAENEHLVKAGRAWLEHPRRDWFLHGDVGTGKTRFVCSLVNELYTRGLSTFFVRVPNLLRTQLQAFDDVERKPAANALFDRVCTSAVVVLDDVAGGEKPSEYSRGMLTTLYDERLDRGRVTLWTSNLDLEALARFYGDDRLPSRIAGACDVFGLYGADRRLAGARPLFSVIKGGA